MSRNNTPQTIRPILAKGRVALTGIMELATPLGIKANDAETFGGAYYVLVGRPADPTATPPVAAIVGKQPLYLERKAQHAAARVAYKQAVAAGREFVASAVDTLKTPLGRRWNARWAAVGFATPSLQLSKDPVPMLLLLEAYYRAHSENEIAVLNLTSAKAMEKLAAIDSARSAVNLAHDREVSAKGERDAAFERMRTRITSLREELVTLLSDDDSRWYRFGFRRPVDGETPDLVEEVNLRLGAPGEVVVEWPKARLAENYRVSWKAAGSTADPMQVGLFADPQAIITGLTQGTTITVIVSARNGAGESAATQADIAVP